MPAEKERSLSGKERSFPAYKMMLSSDANAAMQQHSASISLKKSHFVHNASEKFNLTVNRLNFCNVWREHTVYSCNLSVLVIFKHCAVMEQVEDDFLIYFMDALRTTQDRLFVLL